MTKRLWLAADLLDSCCITEIRAQDPATGDTLWPDIEPLRTDYLRVSEIHELYNELCGMPEGRGNRFLFFTVDRERRVRRTCAGSSTPGSS